MQHETMHEQRNDRSCMGILLESTLLISRDNFDERMMLQGRPSLISRFMLPKNPHDELNILGYWMYADSWGWEWG